MIDNLLRLREPAAWVAVVVTAANIVLAVVRFGLAMATGAALAPASQGVALSAMNLTMVLAVVGLVWVCVFHAPIPRARRLTGAAAAVVFLGALVTLVGYVVGLTASAGVIGVVLEFLGGLLDVVLKVGAAVMLWLIHRGLAAGRIGAGGGAPALADEAPQAVEAAPRDEPDEGRAPAWGADAASGSAWRSASEAAEGVPASSQGEPGQTSGWHPVVRPAADAPGEEPGTEPREG